MKLTSHFSKKRSGFTLGSRLIMWAQGSDFSHCASEIDKEDGTEPMVYEAVAPKARKISKSEWVLHSIPVHSIEENITDPEQIKIIIDTAESEVGTPYSLLQLLVMAIGLIFKLFVKFFETFCLNSSKFKVCSEFMAAIQTARGYKYKKNPDNINVVDCYEAAVSIKEGVKC
jgi:hypothetical protein